MTVRLGATAVTLAAAAALASTVEPAAACSCGVGDPRTTLAHSDAAFVGALVERREGSRRGTSADPVTLVFRVERVVKGDLGETVEVKTPAFGASCGIEASVGQRIGLFLTRRDSSWASGLCAQIAPEKLIAAAAPLPRALGGRAALVVTGRFGTARTLALDAQGRTVAYGRGRGDGYLVSPCPGSRRIVEVALHGGGVLLGVRRLPSFRLAREQRLPQKPSLGVLALICRDARAEEIVLFLRRADGFPQGARLVVLRNGRQRTVWRGSALFAGLSGAHAYVSAGTRGGVLLRVDVRSGHAVRLGRVPPSSGPFVPSPDGRALAAGAYSPPIGGNPALSRVVLVELVPRFRLRTAALGRANVSGDALWLTNQRVAFFPDARGDVDDVRVYDRSLRLRARWQGWSGRGAVLVGKRALGFDHVGRLLVAAAAQGGVRALRMLPSPVAEALAVLPGSPRVAAVQP